MDDRIVGEAPDTFQPLFPGQVKPGHIHVELDFIPVSERLPDRQHVICLLDDGSVAVDCMRWEFYYGGIKADPRCRGLEASRDGAGSFCLPKGTTHWSEIPTFG